MATETKKKKIKKNIPVGIAHVNATFNNTIITITDTKGNTISWSSAGAEGFKGSRKSTPFAAQLAAENAGKKAKDNGVKTLGNRGKRSWIRKRVSVEGSTINRFYYNFYKGCYAYST